MRKRTLSGFIRSKLLFIEQKQEEGFLLPAIHEILEEEWQSKINYDSFLSMLHRARKKNKSKEEVTKKLSFIQNTNNNEKNKTVIETKKIDNISNKNTPSAIQEEIDKQTSNQDFDF